MSKVDGARGQAVYGLGLGDVGEYRDQQLNNRVLEDQKPHPPVPVQPVCGTALLSLIASSAPPGARLRNLEPSEKHFATTVRRRDELTHEQEEIAQGDRLGEVQPRAEIDEGAWSGHLDEGPDGQDGQVDADSQDVELLVGAGQVRRMPEHEDEHGEQGESCAGAGDDLGEGVEVEATGQSGCLGVLQHGGIGERADGLVAVGGAA